MRSLLRRLFCTRSRATRIPAARPFRPGLEPLEGRDVPSVVSVDAEAVVRAVNDHVLGVNLTGWDGYLASKHYSAKDTTPDAGTATMIQNAGLRLLRLSDGSGTDEWHFDKELDPNGFTSGAGLLARITSGESLVDPLPR